MKGTELAVRFSYIVNKLGYCGPHKAKESFADYFSKQNDAEIEKHLKKFEGFYPYLETIAEETGKKFSDFDVVEAYWIGNELLDKCGKDVMVKVIDKLVQRGLPEFIGESLIKELPQNGIPHHLFHVLYVGVGQTTGRVEGTLQNMDNCRPSWGKVVEVMNDKLMVETQPLEAEKNKYKLGKPEIKTVVYMKDMLKGIRKGDFVAIHWGFAPLILTEKQRINLEKYTKKVINIVNST